jgi:hypothetical protein
MRLLLLYALFAVNPIIHASVEIVLDEMVIQVDPLRRRRHRMRPRDPRNCVTSTSHSCR